MASNHNHSQARHSRDHRRSTSIDVLRADLENLAEEETPLPPRRPSAHSRHNDSVVNHGMATAHAVARVNENDDDDSVDKSAEATTTPQRAASIDAAPRRSESGHVVFSDELGHSAGRRPQLRLDMGLYPIQSRVDDTEAAKKWRESRDQQQRQLHHHDGEGDDSTPTVTVNRGHRFEGEDRRSSRVSFVEPPSVTRPRHPRLQLGGVEDSIKRAAQANTTIAHAKDWVAQKRSRAGLLKRTRSFRLQMQLGDWYQRWIVEGLLCQKPLPPSADGRHIPLNPGVARCKNGVGGGSSSGLMDERRAKPYISNFIRSSRYTIWSFLPAQLFFQFSKLANAYFLTISILQMTPGLSTTGTYTTFGPLMAFVAISMAKEGWDDYRRYKLDKLENRTEAYVLDPDGSIASEKQKGGFREKLRRTRQDAAGEMQELSGVVEQEEETPPWSEEEEVRWSKTQWQDIRVGDIIKLRRDENVPADIVLLHATGPNGVAYIETMALDGETNLKSKDSCRLFMEHCGTLSALQACDAEIVSEDPNLDLYNYEGKAVVNGEVMPLTLNQVVYRGSILRNTNAAIGLVINTGEECKIRMNANKNVRAKAPAMQSKVNKIIVVLVFFVVILSLGCSIGNLLWIRDTERFAWYLDNYTLSFGMILVGFVIEFNTLIPLSLYVSLEIIKLGQVMLLRDIDMYDPVSNTPMVANTTTILENLGQVSYVFSDKTGTLTENIMRFRKMSVAGTAWLHDMDIQREAKSKRGRQMQRARADAGYSGSKGKQALRPSTSTMRSDSADDPKLQGRRSMATSIAARSVFASSIHPDNNDDGHGPPLLKTDDLLEYIRKRPDTSFSKKARQFILCIALCHTCLPEKKADGIIDFQAASPDELALVEAAQDLGVLLIDRPAQTLKLRFASNEHGSATTVDETYEVLDVIEFSSKRKRMSIIIRMPDGRICIFSKGADSVILPRLKQRKMAMETALAVDRQASIRKSMEQGKAMRKMSVQSARNSTSLARATSSLGHKANFFGRKSTGRQSTSRNRPSHTADRIIAPTSIGLYEPTATLSKGRNSFHQQHLAYSSPRASMSHGRPMDLLQSPLSMEHDPYEGMVDEAVAVSDSAVFERCFQHIDDFASEGLRTLLYAYRYVDEAEYKQWKTTYLAATTSLVDRQDRIEAAAEQIEQNLDLAGATAIEDKLQQGVPETIDMLRRANIKVWMLTGDKRETAINIAHSARICKPISEVYVLDATTEGLLQEKIAATLVDVGRGMLPHSVVVIDGHTLGVVEADPALQVLFFDLVARVDSVICCRASPSQKASLVQCIRSRVASSLTLAIGDGANDIAMIQASHVGIGISGREGLQAARISDYSIAQFRFLQKLLFVHGRWNYIRTGKYVLGTFWKEVMFYLVQALYQRYDGYTGTSFYESTSLAVFNTLFTSLAVILLGIFEQDLRAETLLAVPELYTYGQKNKAFNFRKYIGWTIMAVLEAVLIFFGIWGIFSHLTFDFDNSLFAMGDLAFTAGVLLINIKLLVLELHNKTVVTFIGFFISVVGWFLWNLFLSAIYTETPGPYAVRDAFMHNFGRTLTWWLTLIMVLAMVVVFELAVTALRRIYWPQDQDLVQEQERFFTDGDGEVVLESTAEMGECWVTPALNNSNGVDGDDGDDGDAEEEQKQKQERQNTGKQALVGAIKAWRPWPRGGHKRKTSRNLSGDLYLAPPLVEPPGSDDGAEREVLSFSGEGVEAAGDGNGKKRTVRTSTSEVRTAESASARSLGNGDGEMGSSSSG